MAYPRSLSSSIGHAPATVCHSSAAKSGSGSGAAACQRATAARHSCGISDSTASRARTSSDRLVSWVASVVIAAGQRASRRRAAAWNSSGGTPK